MTAPQQRAAEREVSAARIEATPGASASLARIAKTELGIETLETRNLDGLDFHDLSVASIKAALIAAYEVGRRAGF